MYFVTALSYFTLESEGGFRRHRLPRVGAFQRGEAELEGSDVVPGRMVRLAVILDRAEEFAHGPLEARLEP